ncbi:MAG: tetratricopeptide repeat protein [Woeseia sp.]|nr:tetratricopeptide repeat protein [Woeseia sp.]MBT8097729.1 tetratricopeptide repeat protein [Woeseia sp.]NNE62085.1 tetratricopeptide repeat protein [Woeseia sp.]NNL54927.1 tetratricopeptide repeat protein [Woeseia sp.]
MRLFDELRRRNVFRVAAAYAVLAWLIIQVVETIFPAFGFGAGAVRIVVITLAIGFVPTLIFSWIFELTPDGLKLDKHVSRAESIADRTGKMLDRGILVVLAVALAYFAFDKFVLDPVRDEKLQESARQEGRSEAIIASVGTRSIAVLPFVDMSPSGDQSYFSDGVSEELLNLLARIPQVRVTSRSSAFAIKDKGLSTPEIAERLNVTYVLDGSVRKAGEQVRISAQLIDANSDTQLWSQNFDRTLQNIFQIQDEIASEVVEQIKGTLQIDVPVQRQTDPEAYALFLQARHQRRQGTPGGYDKAIALYRQAIELDPNYPPAWDEMSAAYLSQAITGLASSEEGFAKARESALKAIEIDPTYAPAFDSLGFIAQYFEADLSLAANYYQRALELEPQDMTVLGSVGILLQNIGRLEEGIAPIEFAVAADPLSPGWHYTLGIAYLTVNRPDDAMTSFQKTLAMSPNFSLGYYNLAVALTLAGRPDEALVTVRNESREGWRLLAHTIALCKIEQQPEETGVDSVANSPDLMLPDSAAESIALLEERYANNLSYNISYVHAFCGNTDAAFVWLEKAVALGDSGLGALLSEALLQNLHDDPRWLPFLRKIGKAPEQLAPIKLSYQLPT